ncbi:retropepsin-like aspartic protease family protein [Jannaschia formosa]|uniref:retropepsin-like aspartic protease family protein n=1 Tax=Jannaschia formosa TaxID=2259592 RepID=UPI000E1BE0B9|nr:TIGR02281 family clan AA aspartic protease [Jannaschia formosa]TFL19615.1 TIGR02281 family clan AA aspartic protease [Jannaschia formosa]
MDTDALMRLLYLVLLGSVIALTFFASTRQRMGKTLQQAAIWFLIFVGAVLAYGVWEDVKGIAVPTQSVMTGAEGVIVDVPRARDGHYHLTLGINGVDVEFIVDTGATDLVLTRRDAQRVGLAEDQLAFLGEAMTANGSVRTAAVRLDEVTLGDIVDRHVPAVVNGGEMRQSLLGMSYLSEFGRIEIENDELRLIR